MKKSNARVGNEKKNEGGRGLLLFEATYKTEIINTEEYLNTKYTADQSVNGFRNQVSNLPTMNSTIQIQQLLRGN